MEDGPSSGVLASRYFFFLRLLDRDYSPYLLNVGIENVSSVYKYIYIMLDSLLRSKNHSIFYIRVQCIICMLV